MELHKFTNYSNKHVRKWSRSKYQPPTLCASNLARGDANGESKQLVEPYI